MQIWRLIADGAARGKYGVLAVSHDMPLLEAVAGRIVAMPDISHHTLGDDRAGGGLNLRQRSAEDPSREEQPRRDGQPMP